MAFLRQQEPILSRPAPFSPEETASLIAESRKPQILAQLLRGSGDSERIRRINEVVGKEREVSTSAPERKEEYQNSMVTSRDLGNGTERVWDDYNQAWVVRKKK